MVESHAPPQLDKELLHSLRGKEKKYIIKILSASRLLFSPFQI